LLRIFWQGNRMYSTDCTLVVLFVIFHVIDSSNSVR
jgi:hypothetical protein